MNNPDNENLAALKQLSRRLGEDPLQVQGAGGNTSVKLRDTLWVKASGTWLKNAEHEDLFVPVALSRLLRALDQDDPATEKSLDFVVDHLNNSALRPSIETTVHAVLPQRFVVHTHCVDTIAVAAQVTGKQILEKLLADYNWLWVPYLRPGLPLSRYIRQHLQPDTDIVVLGNHGLIVAGESINETEMLMNNVRRKLRQPVRTAKQINTHALTEYCSGTSYVASEDAQTNSMAFDPISTNIAAKGSFYPDHVIFLGNAMTVAKENETLQDTIKRVIAEGGAEPICIVVPNKGVVLKSNANPGQHAMARCISDVAARLSDKADVNYLNPEQVYMLLNWEAEQYRQKLNG